MVVPRAVPEKESDSAKAMEVDVKERDDVTPKEEEEIMPYDSPEDRERLVPWEGEMPKDSVPATNEWIET